MRTETKEIDVFDRAYCDRIRDIVWSAILEGTRDPVTNMSALRNYEIYDALLQIQAMIVASAKQASSPTEMRTIGKSLQRDFVGWSLSSRKCTIVTGCPSLL